MSQEGVRYMWEHATDVWEIPAVPRQQRDLGHNAVCPVEIPFVVFRPTPRKMEAYWTLSAVRDDADCRGTGGKEGVCCRKAPRVL